MTKNLWIIGELTPELPESLFPTQKRILQTIFYLRDDFIVPANTVLTIHWDGKLMQDTTNQKEQNPEKCDRLGVVVSGHNIQKILGGPKISNFKLLKC
jgi:hypothetical protein